MTLENYELYPEFTNPGISMADISKDYFTHELVTAENGQQYHLLKARNYPYTVLQVNITKDIHEFRMALNVCKRHGWVEYVEYHTDHVVIDLGAWQHVDLNQQNAQHVADLIHEDIRNGARWWVMYGMNA